ncbi:mercaptopyruvate sulfurtransferase [Trypanosoma conorhini]|uniref:Mercaptopyruvate sulfurtransferase n=1 Tax=Trypanosoma conorhini TaxID=83891 RepID=A0A422N5Q2_9TRYP|nr:mercaptopyruvate sulfurtransferase [Trypanosoma conorhini]RNF00771.1 mercaptopyruvate sulfurtransferase [Trypanosoma conorhini]
MQTSGTPRHPGKVFVAVADVAHCLADFQVFDVRYSLCDETHGKRAYHKGHLPGAVFVDVDGDLSGPITLATGRHPLPDAAAFVGWCKSKAIGAGRPALCYDDVGGAMGACRMWWMLHSLGIEAYVLDGGFQAYDAAGLPLETGLPEVEVEPLEKWPYATSFKRALTIEEVPPNAVMVDARPASRFSSTVRPHGFDTLPGSVQNALSCPWDGFMQCKDQHRCLKPDEECRRIALKALESVWEVIHADASNCVFFCGSGVTATLSIAVLSHLGLGETFLYGGSWSQYGVRFAFSTARRIVEEHGMFFKMLSPNLDDSPAVTAADAATVVVDGAVAQQPDAEVAAAVAHMRIGEKAQVFFKSHRTAVIEVLPK